MDAELRRAERAWRADPSPEHAAQRWAEVLRAGVECSRCFGRLTLVVPGSYGKTKNLPVMNTCPRCAGLTWRQRCKLAAYCGDEGARLVLGWDCCDAHRDALAMGVDGSATPCAHPSLGTMLRDAQRGRGIGRAPLMLVRAGRAAAGVALPVWERSPAADRTLQVADLHDHGPYTDNDVPDAAIACPECTDHAPRRALDAVDAWLLCPCAEHREAWRAAFVAAGAVPDWLPSVWNALHEPPMPSARVRADEIQAAVRAVGDEAPVRAAICADLVTWASCVSSGPPRSRSRSTLRRGPTSRS